MEQKEANSEFEIKKELNKEQAEYLANHPEIDSLLNKFVSSIISSRPEDINKYAEDYFKKNYELHHPATLIVSGPSAVGKGSIINLLMKNYSHKFALSVSYTTRAPRKEEQHGVHYMFVTKEEFLKEIEAGNFLEHCEVHGNYYGTNKTMIQKILNEKKIPILDIDIQGATTLSKALEKWDSIFILPPSLEDLKKRMIGRGSETEESAARRLGKAETEINYAKTSGIYKHFVINDELSKAYEDFVKIVKEIYQGLE